MRKSRNRIVLIAAFLLGLPVIAYLGYGFLWLPVKYRYIVWRVESARTAVQEQTAFKLAANYGRVWEVNRLSLAEAVENSRRLSVDWLLRLEFLDSSPFGGGAYCAYRTVIDTNNLRILYEKHY